MNFGVNRGWIHFEQLFQQPSFIRCFFGLTTFFPLTFHYIDLKSLGLGGIRCPLDIRPTAGISFLHCVGLEVPSEVEENLRQAAILVICSSIKSPNLWNGNKHVVNGAKWGTEKNGASTMFIPQVALAIGVLTFNRRGGWLPTLAGFTLGAIAGCHCWVLATNFGGVHVGCHCWVPCSVKIWPPAVFKSSYA